MLILWIKNKTKQIQNCSSESFPKHHDSEIEPFISSSLKEAGIGGLAERMLRRPGREIFWYVLSGWKTGCLGCICWSVVLVIVSHFSLFPLEGTALRKVAMSWHRWNCWDATKTFFPLLENCPCLDTYPLTYECSCWSHIDGWGLDPHTTLLACLFLKCVWSSQSDFRNWARVLGLV